MAAINRRLWMLSSLRQTSLASCLGFAPDWLESELRDYVGSQAQAWVRGFGYSQSPSINNTVKIIKSTVCKERETQLYFFDSTDKSLGLKDR